MLFILMPIIGCILSPRLSILNATILLCYLGGGYSTTMNFGNWIAISNLYVDWEINIDNLTRAILFPILFINLIVQIYSLEYISEDPHISRFYFFINFFVATMIILVTADNLFVLFVGWEGVGLASYLLINFWYTRIYANLAGIKAFLTNRVGDWGLTLGILFFWVVFGSVSLQIQFLPMDHGSLSLVGLGIALGAITKSAQIGLHSWLTRSMEGPTPVSALLHAATMVTAGVYLMLRMQNLWSEDLCLIISWIGGLSALGGAIGGLLEQDLKKIIAYSTISQLGYMFLALGVCSYNICLWHLVNHACFKALLFLSGGAFIHSFFGLQDIRKASIPHLYPGLSFAFLIGNLSIMAIPFMTGWWTKDKILLEVYKINTLLFLFIYFSAFFTAAYSIKLFISLFSTRGHIRPNSWKLHPFPFTFIFTLGCLSIPSVFFGYFTSAYYSFLLAAGFTPPVLTDNFDGTFVLIASFMILVGFTPKLRIPPFGILDLFDQIGLHFLMIIFPISTYLFRNSQAMFEIFFGGRFCFRLAEGLAFRLELLRG